MKRKITPSPPKVELIISLLEAFKSAFGCEFQFHFCTPAYLVSNKNHTRGSYEISPRSVFLNLMQTSLKQFYPF